MMNWVLDNKMFNCDHCVLVKTSILANLCSKVVLQLF